MNRGDACLVVWRDGSTDPAEFKGEVSPGHVDVWLNDRLMCALEPNVRVVPLPPDARVGEPDD